MCTVNKQALIGYPVAIYEQKPKRHEKYTCGGKQIRKNGDSNF